MKQPYGMDYPEWIASLVKSGDLIESDAKILLDSAVATRKVIMVDDFPGDFLQAGARDNVQQGLAVGG